MHKPLSLVRRQQTTGVAAVECAIIMPVMVLLVLGAVDVGQFAHVHQKVTEASREAARFAVRYDTTSAQQVTSMCIDYLQDAFPNCSIESAAQIELTDANDLTTLPSGSQVNVQVTIPYNSVRWFVGFPILGGQSVTATTAMRRE